MEAIAVELSTSDTSSVPPAFGLPALTPLSVTAPVSVPLKVATSLVPLMVTVMVSVVPSTDFTVKVSDTL